MSHKRNATTFINQVIDEHKSNSEEYSTVISLRLKPKQGLMIKEMAKGLNFSASTAFTDMISKHLFDIMVSLEPEDFEAISKAAKDDDSDDSVLSALREAKAIKDIEWSIELANS